jgi:hypothetical protein
MAEYVQTVYSVNPTVGYVGDISRPGEPFALDSGLLGVSGVIITAPTPGMGVYWDTTTDRFRVADSAATRLLICGILHYRKDDVQDADDEVVFADGAFVEVCIMGTIWVTAGAACEYNQILEFFGDGRWDGIARQTAVASIKGKPVVSASRFSAVDTDIIEARIGYGNVL